MRKLLLFVSVVLHTSCATKCIDHDLNEPEKVVNCKNSNDACSVVWMGSSARDAKITQRACWTESETTNPKCHVGACIPEKLETTHKSTTVGYFCCCRGDLCNKNPEAIKQLTTTDAPKSDPRVQIRDSSPLMEISSAILLSVGLVVTSLLVVAVFLILVRRRRQRHLYRDLEATSRSSKKTKFDLTKQLCETHGRFPSQLWMGNRRSTTGNSSSSGALIDDVQLTVQTLDQASAVRWAREVALLGTENLSHEHVVSVLWWGKKHRKSWIVYNDVYVGTLTHVLRSCSLSLHQGHKLGQCIFAGLSYLHCTIHAGRHTKVAVAHGDLCSDNILLKANFVPVLGNFHNSTRLQYLNLGKLTASVENYSKLMSSFHYVPPELLLPITSGHHHRWTTLHTDNSYRQMDVYMASLLLWQITRRTLEGGALPFTLPYEDTIGEEPSLVDIAAVVATTRPHLESQWLHHPDLRRICWLLQSGWKSEPSQRLTAHCIHRLMGDPAALDAIASYQKEP